ncbi:MULTISPECIES: hypothetical protein [Bacillus]|mgnify:CR=1 FL=1|uniref:hypothetical protein n=1 Tax=Bacillus TaxID=1386 RepID=UPI000D042E90|nr:MULTISPECIES: hypothetical protein [Bacillus]MCM3140296.1 hypothetical protein [Bacillus safensis]PRS35725.1 hypothetical protein C6Y02_17080 [Bacillus sp. NMCC4]
MKQRGRLFNLEELNAYKIAYGEPIKGKDIYREIFIPFLVAAGLVFSLYYYWWLSLLAGFAAVFYSFKVGLPRNIKKAYYLDSFEERNRFVNEMTQFLSNENLTVQSALKLYTYRATGEFQKDLLYLEGGLRDATNQEKISLFNDLRKKYSMDIPFDMFVEQLLTSMLEGRRSSESMMEITKYHNEVKEMQKKYIRRKDRHEREFRLSAMYGVAVIVVLTGFLGWDKFIDAYAHTPFSWVFSTIYLIYMAKLYTRKESQMADDNVMEVTL